MDGWDRLAVLLIASCAALVYVNTMDGQMAFDDNLAIVRNEDTSPDSVWVDILQHDFWGNPIYHPASHKSYRPLTITVFRGLRSVNRHFLGKENDLDTRAFHVLAIALHSLCSVLLFFVSKHIFFMPKCGAKHTHVSQGYSWAPFISAMVFAVHSSHTEAVAGIVCLAETLCCTFMLSAFLCWGKSWESGSNVLAGLSLVFVAAATFSKEVGLTAIALMFGYDIARTLCEWSEFWPTHKSRMIQIWKKYATRSVLLVVTGLGYIQLRRSLAPDAMKVGEAVFRHVENPIAFAESAETRVFSLIYLYYHYFMTLVWPMVLSADWSFDCVPLVTSAHDPRNWVTIPTMASIVLVTIACAVVYLSSVCCAHNVPTSKEVKVKGKSNSKSSPSTVSANDRNLRKRKQDRKKEHTHSQAGAQLSAPTPTPPTPAYTCNACLSASLLFSCAWMIIPFLPATNLFAWVGTFVGERLLYVPSIGYCMALGLSPVLLSHLPWSAARKVFRIPLLAVLSLYALALSWRTVRRNVDWSGESTLFLSALEVCPRSVKVMENVGILYRRTEEWEKSLSYFHQAKLIDPTFCDVDYWIGLTYLNKGDQAKGIEVLHQAVNCKFNQAHTAQTLQAVYQVVLQQNPDDPVYNERWGDVLEAIQQFHGASGAANYFIKAGMAHSSQDKPKEAVRVFRKAFLSASRDPPSDEELPPERSVSDEVRQEGLCIAQYWYSHSLASSKKKKKQEKALELLWKTARDCESFRLHALDLMIPMVQESIKNNSNKPAYHGYWAFIHETAQQTGWREQCNQHYRTAAALSEQASKWKPAMDYYTSSLRCTEKPDKEIEKRIAELQRLVPAHARADVPDRDGGLQ